MANRPVFMSITNKEKRICKQTFLEFTFFNGFAKTQKQKCIHSLHESFSMEYPGRKVLDISRYSTEPLGVQLSAFNMQVPLSDGRKVPMECAYQAGKVFERGGPYTDLLDVSAKEAKADPRLKNSGQIIGFQFDGQEFPTVPRSLFYNWLYVNALKDSPELAERVMEYEAFTDIVFNPEKSDNCQAEAAAYFVSLKKLNLLDEALADINSFLKIAYKQQGVAELAELLPNEPKVVNIPEKKPVQDTSQVKQESADIQRTGRGKKTAAKEEPAAVNPKPERLFEVGEAVDHPRFGQGKITGVTDSGNVEVNFQHGGTKIMSAKWLHDNCRKSL